MVLASVALYDSTVSVGGIDVSGVGVLPAVTAASWMALGAGLHRAGDRSGR